MSRKLRVLDLFSGIGGFSLGLERTGGFETVAFCEIEEFPRRVLAKHWPEVPIFEDVRKLTGGEIDGPIDLICGGYPCQPFSTAGKRRGAEDDRHLWPEFNRLVAELRPSWVIGENVAGHVSMGLDSVLSDLEGQGYACRTFVVPACAIAAPHRRDRCWTIGHSDSEPARALNDETQELSALGHVKGQRGSERDAGAVGSQQVKSGRASCYDNVADAKRKRQSGPGQPCIASNRQTKNEGQANHALAVSQRPERRAKPAMGGMADGLSTGLDGPCRWPDEPAIGRVAHGIPDRSARLKALGNAVVPQIPEMIGHAILAAEKEQAA